MDCHTFARLPFHTPRSFHCSCSVRDCGRPLGPQADALASLLSWALQSYSGWFQHRSPKAYLHSSSFVMFHLCSVLVISWSFYNCSTVSQDKLRGTEERGKSRNNLLLGERLNLLRFKDIWLDTLHLIGFFFFFPSLSLTLSAFLSFLSFTYLALRSLRASVSLSFRGQVNDWEWKTLSGTQKLPWQIE